MSYPLNANFLKFFWRSSGAVQTPSYFVETLLASWRLPPKAADLASVRASSFCVEDKRTAALIFSKPPLGYVEWAHKSNLPGNGFFLSPSGGAG